MNGRVLIVDDQPEIVRVLRGYFEQAGFTVISAYDGNEALRMARAEKPDLILLDIMLPGTDGLDVCRRIRRDSDVPIIMLTARVEETDTLIGLELGADDYITKPFSPREVVARARAVLRRIQSQGRRDEEILEAHDLRLDVTKRSLSLAGRALDLTASEFDILHMMMREPGRVFSRAQLLEATQGVAYEGYERTIDTHIKNLRRKLGDSPRNPSYIQTVHGIGYRLLET